MPNTDLLISTLWMGWGRWEGETEENTQRCQNHDYLQTCIEIS